MSALVKKEIRLLLPLWIGTLLVVILATISFRGDGDNGIGFSVFFIGIGCIVLAAASYGLEFSHGTFPFLLSHPAQRARIWNVKLAVLTAALLSIALVFAICEQFPPAGHIEMDDCLELVFFLAATVTAFCASIVVRQMFAAFWLAWFVPMALLALSLFASSFDRRAMNNPNLFFSIPLALLAGFGIWWSRRCYFRAQDLKSSEDAAVTFSWPAFRRRSEEQAAIRRYSPWRALAAKEFRLQTFSLVAIVALFLLNLGVIALLGISGDAERGYWSELSTISYLITLAWFAIPLLVASGIVADEQRLAIADTQYCLPFSRNRIFAFKVLFAVLIGALLPAVLFRVLVSLDRHRSLFGIFNLPEFGFGLVWLVFTSIAFTGIFASTLTRQSTEAFVIGFGLAFALSGSTSYAFEHERFKIGNHLLWAGTQAGYLLFLAVLIALPWLAWLNFRTPDGIHRYKRAIIGFLLVLTFPALLSTVIYHRAWELSALRAQPPARISIDAAPAAKIGSEITLRFQDGRLWRGSLEYGPPEPTPNRTPVALGPHGFEAGSDWAMADPAGRTTFAIRDDGTLWYSDLDKPGTDFPTCSAAPRFAHRPGSKMRQKVHDNDWAEVSAGPFPYLLKKDGTLWHWGINYESPQSEVATAIQYFNAYLKSVPSLLGPGIDAFQIFRVGKDSDWKHLRYNEAEKMNGEIWALSPQDGANWWPHDAKARELSTGIWGRLVKPAGSAVQDEWRSLLAGDRSFSVGVKKDGTFWAWNVFWTYKYGQDLIDVHLNEPVQVGSGSNWHSLMRIEKGDCEDVVLLLKSDGALWQWNPSLDEEDRWQRLGRHQKWVALYSSELGSLLLAADGGLWTWRAEPSAHEFLGLPGIKLEPRELQYLGNIFDAK